MRTSIFMVCRREQVWRGFSNSFTRGSMRSTGLILQTWRQRGNFTTLLLLLMQQPRENSYSREEPFITKCRQAKVPQTTIMDYSNESLARTIPLDLKWRGVAFDCENLPPAKSPGFMSMNICSRAHLGSIFFSSQRNADCRPPYP